MKRLSFALLMSFVFLGLALGLWIGDVFISREKLTATWVDVYFAVAMVCSQVWVACFVLCQKKMDKSE